MLNQSDPKASPTPEMELILKRGDIYWVNLTRQWVRRSKRNGRLSEEGLLLLEDGLGQVLLL